MPMVIIDEACFPQRVKLLDVCTDLHLDARHTVRIFAVCQIATASITVTLNPLSRAGLPWHSGNQHCGCGVNGSIQLKVQSHILGIVHGHIGNAGNLGPVENIVVIGQIAVCSCILATLTHAHSRTHEEVCALRFRHEHSLYSSFCHRRGILVTVGSASLQLATVTRRPMAQPPLSQNILLVAVSPQGIISRDFTSQSDGIVGACPRHRGQSGAAGHAALGIFTAMERRVPCQPAAALVRGYITSHRFIATAGEGTPTVIDIGAVLPFFHGQRQRKAVDGSRLARKVKLCFALQRQHIHGAIFQRKRIRTDIPCKRVFLRPIRCLRACIRQERRSFTAVRQVIQRSACIVATHIIAVKAHGVGFAFCILGQHLGETLQALVFCRAVSGRQWPPIPEHLTRVLTIQQAIEDCVNELSTSITGSYASQNVVLPF